MDEVQKQVDELAVIANELWAREFSNNCPTTSLRGISWDELCNKAILLALSIKAFRASEMDIEIRTDDEHYGYYDNIHSAIADLLYIEKLHN